MFGRPWPLGRLARAVLFLNNKTKHLRRDLNTPWAEGPANFSSNSKNLRSSSSCCCCNNSPGLRPKACSENCCVGVLFKNNTARAGRPRGHGRPNMLPQSLPFLSLFSVRSVSSSKKGSRGPISGHFGASWGYLGASWCLLGASWNQNHWKSENICFLNEIL